MAPRATYANVCQILSTTLTEPEVGAYLTAANLLVDKLLEDAGFTEEYLTEIERWLTAHFIACTREQQAQSEGAGEATIKYQGTTGESLRATFYGQQVLLLDTSGAFAEQALVAELEQPKQASIYAVTSFDE